MKTVYILALILLSNIAGAVVTNQAAKTLFLMISGGLAIFGLARLI